MLYKISSQQVRTIDDVTYLMAETPVMGKRQHRRMIGASRVQPDLYSRAILYADSYISANDTNFAYCSHRADPPLFLNALDTLLLEQLDDFPEFKERDFPIILTKNGQLEQHKVRLPFSASLVVDDHTEFIRCYIPLGDITISFGKPFLPIGELECAQGDHSLLGRLETPLLACDMTKSTILVKLLARLHWASKFLSETTLEHLIEQLSFSSVAA